MKSSLLFAALLLATPLTYKPTAKFTVTCAPGGRSCTMNASGSDSSATGAIVKYDWSWGNGRSESHTTPTATNTWASGTWCVKLTVTDRSGLTSFATKQITVPYVAGAKFPACPKAPPVVPPVKPETVFVVKTDTLWRVRVDTLIRVVRDTVIIVRVDTVKVQLPAPPPIHDTITVKLPPDTVRIVTHDTISTALPVLPPGIVITDPNGDRFVRFNNQVLGRLIIRADNLVEAARFNPAVTFGQHGLKVQGVYNTQVEAIAALMLPAPSGFNWQ